MASVYYLFDDAKDISDKIIWRTEANHELDKKRYFAALMIQRAFRGFIVRRRYKKMTKSIITIQKHVRGYLLGLHLEEIAAEAFKNKCMALFNKNATKIQAAWRGYWTRKNVNLKVVLEEKREAEAAQKALNDYFKKLFQNDGEDPSPPAGDMNEKDQITSAMTKQSSEILQVLFDKHHLLRTHQIEGVLSKHGSKELSLLEELLKKIECKEYMDTVRELYKEDCSPKFEYMFRDRRARRIEDLLREKECREGAQKIGSITEKSIHKKPFVLPKKTGAKPYERNMLAGEVYTGLPQIVLREEVRGERPRFILDTKHIFMGGEKEQPYFIDHWKKPCYHHNFTYDCVDDRKS